MKNFSNTSVLVTGGNGAIGCNLVRKLLSLNAKVTVLDDFSQSERGNLTSNNDLRIIKGDITNKKVLSKVFSRQFDYVFHLAARFANTLSIKDPLEDLRVNAQGTLQVLMYVSRQKPERFLYASSSSVYGLQKSTQLKEDIILHPSTPYAASKLAAEHYCRTFHELHGIDCTIVRLSNSYGPFDPPGIYRNVIPNFMQAALFGKNLVITGTGNETRDFTYVDDCVNGIILAARENRGKNETFNLGTGKETSVRKIAGIILKITKSKSRIIFKPMRSFDHIKNRRMDISKAQKMLHYNPTIDIERGLEKTYRWFLNG